MVSYHSYSSGAICIHEPKSLRRLYRIKAPGRYPPLPHPPPTSTSKLTFKLTLTHLHAPTYTSPTPLPHTFHTLSTTSHPLPPSSSRLSPDLSAAIQALSTGNTYKGPVTSHLNEGIVSSMTLWARRSLLLCTLGGSTVVHVMSLLTGEAITTFAGHIGVLTCVAISPTHGLIFTGEADRYILLITLNSPSIQRTQGASFLSTPFQHTHPPLPFLTFLPSHLNSSHINTLNSSHINTLTTSPLYPPTGAADRTVRVWSAYEGTVPYYNILPYTPAHTFLHILTPPLIPLNLPLHTLTHTITYPYTPANLPSNKSSNIPPPPLSKNV